MKRFLSCALFCGLLFFCAGRGLCTAFDERLWEKYAEIEAPSRDRGSLAGVYLEPQHLGDSDAKTPFADLRIVTDRKEEVPWQIVLRRPEKLREEIPARMFNLSRTEQGETWLELACEKQDFRVNAVEVITPDTDFSRQVQVLGSPDGSSWNLLRRDGVIFDITQGEKLRQTRITFPSANFRHLALKINNGDAQPLTIKEVKVLQERDERGQTYTIKGMVDTPESNANLQENSLVVRMNTVFPLDRLIIVTEERNFKRLVEVQVKRGAGDWVRWAQGSIFNFDTKTIHESRLAIDMPEIAAREFRLVFRNFDNPPLAVSSVNGEGYRRLLVFKQLPDRKLYLFWGNPLAQQPQYDLAGLIARQKPDDIPHVSLGMARPNSGFAGDNARLPFTERYKYLLYAIIALAIAGLILLQYRVFKRVGS